MVRTVRPARYHADVELRHLRYFVAIATDLNFTRAAQQLHVAQPALSRQIRQLEGEMGVQLFERDRRRVSLTRAGTAFLEEARTILAHSAQAVSLAQAEQEKSAETLRFGYVWGLFHSLVPPWLARFRQAHPKVSVHLLDVGAVQQSQLILEGKLDAGFIGFAEEATAPGLAKQRIGSCRFMAVLPEKHRLARRSALKLAELAGEMLVSVSDESYPGAARIIRESFRAAGIQPRILQVAERGYTVLGLVAANCGLALLPQSLQDLPHPGVVFLPVKNSPTQDLYLVWDRRNKSARLKQFLTGPFQ